MYYGNLTKKLNFFLPILSGFCSFWKKKKEKQRKLKEMTRLKRHERPMETLTVCSQNQPHYIYDTTASNQTAQRADWFYNN